MSKTWTLSHSIWLIEVKPLDVARVYTLLPVDLRGGIIKRVRLAWALNALDKRIVPPFILLEGQPDRAVQTAMSQIHERADSLPVFVISRWRDSSEMRTWFSRYFTELATVAPAIQEESINIYQLSARELEILRFMVKGLIKKEIAEQLSISYHTVDNHERNIFRKMNVHNRSAAVAKALIEKIC
jgi:DNA-binding CsgD family transcriptional regulator